MTRSAYRIAGATLAAGLFLATAAQAQDGALTAPHDLYFNGAIGGSVLSFSGASNVAKTYYGVDASAEVCGATAAGFDVCGGLNGFH